MLDLREALQSIWVGTALCPWRPPLGGLGEDGIVGTLPLTLQAPSVATSSHPTCSTFMKDFAYVSGHKSF